MRAAEPPSSLLSTSLSPSPQMSVLQRSSGPNRIFGALLRLSREYHASRRQKELRPLLIVAREVVTEQGAEASLRDIARKAGVGSAPVPSLPTREGVARGLLRASFDALTVRAGGRGPTYVPSRGALVSWLREMVLLRTLAAASSTDGGRHRRPGFRPLHSCQPCGRPARIVGARAGRGQGTSRLDGADLFALVGALAWIGDQPSLVDRFDHLFEVISSAVLVRAPAGAATA